MSRVYNFSAGPSMLPEEVLKKAQEEMLEYGTSGMSVMEMSHRSKDFDDIIKGAEKLVRELMNGSDFAKKLGVKDVVTHMGFIPENPLDSNYRGLIVAIRSVAQHCASNGQNLLFETGQETPVTLLRAIQDIGTDNLGVNLDPANLILYGKANPVDAMETIGKYVRGVHGKDGKYPTDGHNLGQETPIGQGRVDFKKLIKLLAENGYDGSITIEREITGDEQTRDILAGKKYLEDIINNL